MRLRADITGDATRATNELAHRAVRLLHRGHPLPAVRAWVNTPRRHNRYGTLAVLAVLTLLGGTS